MVEDKILYTFRGWLAFVAFMDLGVTFRSFFENKCIIGTQTNLQADEHFIHGTKIVMIKKDIIELRVINTASVSEDIIILNTS